MRKKKDNSKVFRKKKKRLQKFAQQNEWINEKIQLWFSKQL